MKSRLDNVSRLAPTFEQTSRLLRMSGSRYFPNRLVQNFKARTDGQRDLAIAAYRYRRGASLSALTLG